MNEIEWRPVVGYEGDYEVSSDGRIRSRKTGHYRELSGRLNRFTGYRAVDLYKDGVGKTFPVHRIVATAFIPNPDNLPYINHKDENKVNNAAQNLEWCTSAYNSEYSKHKRQKRVSVYDLEGVRLATFASETIAARFLNVSKSAISQAAAGPHETCCGLVLRLEG